MMFNKFSTAVAIVWSIGWVNPLLALSPAEVSQVAKSSTVRILTNQGHISGVIVRKEGNQYTVLTVTSGTLKNPPTIFTADGRKHSGQGWQSLANPNLATLKFTSSSNYKAATIPGNSLLASKNIFIAGYPIATRAISAPVYTMRNGKLSNKSNGSQLSYNASLLPGMEGSGIFDDSGQLVGIHHKRTSQSNRSDAANSNVQFQSGENAGIPIGIYVAATLDNNTYDRSNADSSQPSMLEQVYSASISMISLNRNYRDAITSMDQNIQKNPNDPVSYAARGYAKFESGDKRGALTDFNRALQLKPDFPDVLLHRGITKASLGDQKGAITDIRQAIKLRPQNPVYHYYLGLGLYEQGDKTGAIKSLQESMDLYKSQGKTAEAQKVADILRKIKA
jgi:tetratricopeptide (TPR) repeat protein